jgi:cysteinyl-tRNA synthetase
MEFLQAGHVAMEHETALPILPIRGSTVIQPAVEHDTALPIRAIVGGQYSAETVMQLIAERAAARKSKNFNEADRIRKVLLDAGIVLEDSPDGQTTWRRS